MSGKRAILVAIAGAGLLNACAVGPHYATPATPPSGQGAFVSAAPALAVDQPLPALWWRLYNDPVLDRLGQQALVENQDLKVAAANLAYAQALLSEARAGRYPSTAINAGPSYGRTSAQVAAGLPATLTWAADFTAAYQVDLFGRVRRTIEAASANADAVAATEDAVRVTVAARTAGAYANICGYGHQIAVARQSVQIVQQAYDIAVRERDAGAISDFEVEREATLLDQARAAIAPLDGQRRAALFTLAALIGATPAQVPADAAQCVAAPILTQPLPVGDGAAMLRRRPDLRQSERQLAAATARIGVATADLYPNITLSGSVGSAATTFSGLFTGSAFSYGVAGNTPSTQPLISWTFPNILVARAHIRETSAQASAALAGFDGAVLTALKESEQALTAYAAELDHHAALAAARDHANAALRLADIQYKAGVDSFLDLLTTQQTAVNAEQAVAASDQAIAADQVAVFQALGGGWENAPKVTPPVIR